MAQDVIIQVNDRSGDVTREKRKIISATDDTYSVTHQTFALSANTKTAVSLGGVTTGSTLLVVKVSGDEPIQVYQGNSNEYWTMDDVFLVLGASFTQLGVKSADDAVLWIYIGGS